MTLLGLALGACQTSPHYGLPRDASLEEVAEARRLLGLSLDDWVRQTARVQRISQRVRLAGRDVCGHKLSTVLGASLIDLRQMPPEFRPLMEERYGGRSGLRVVEVFSGMPAEVAGLQPGDSLIRMGGIGLNRMRDVTRVHDEDADVLEVIIERGDQRLELNMPQELGCAFYARYYQPILDAVNASTDGLQVNMYAAMVRDFDDNALAMVVGHEFGHGILRSVLRRRWSGPEAEAESDYLGVYLAARAGMLGDVENSYIALQEDLNELDEASRSHPMTHERTLALRRAIEEVRRKQAAGEPLLPRELP